MSKPAVVFGGPSDEHDISVLTGLQVAHTMVDMQWQDGKRVIVWPAEAKIGEVWYPKPDFP